MLWVHHRKEVPFRIEIAFCVSLSNAFGIRALTFLQFCRASQSRLKTVLQKGAVLQHRPGCPFEHGFCGKSLLHFEGVWQQGFATKRSRFTLRRLTKRQKQSEILHGLRSFTVPMLLRPLLKGFIDGIVKGFKA